MTEIGLKIVSSVKWNHIFSYTFAVMFGVRQGSVLSPIMFAIYLNDVHAARSLTPRSYIILYADDIWLIAPSIGELQSLFHVYEIELNWLDMSINEKKSCYIRIGPRSDLKCGSITTSNGHNLHWVNEVRYLHGHILYYLPSAL